MPMLRWVGTIAAVCALCGVGAADEGVWFIRGQSGVWTNDTRHPAAKKLQDVTAKSANTLLAFTPQDDWTLLGDGNRAWSSDPALPLHAKLQALAKAGHAFHWLAYAPDGGWVICHDRNGSLAEGVPAPMRAALAGVAKADVSLRCVAFGPQGGWLIVTDEAVHGEGLPEALDKALRARVQERVGVRCVAFTSAGNWFVIDDRNQLVASDAEHPAAKKLQELRVMGETLQWIAFAPGEYPAGYVLQRTQTRRVKGVLEYTIEMPGGGVAEWIATVASAPVLDRQRDVETTLMPAGKLEHDLSPLKRPLLVARVKDRPRNLEGRLTIEATLYATRLRPRLLTDAPVKADLDVDAAKLYTRVSSMEDFKARTFQQWVDQQKLRRGKDENEMAFARRVFLHLKHSLTYEQRAGQEHRASAVCQAGKADCSGMSHLFVATLRAGGVPARVVVGRHAESEKPAAKPGDRLGSQRHVRAEFFARGVGWVPVEMQLAVMDERRGELAHFGNDAGDFLAMYVDSELVVDSHVAGRVRLTNAQGINWWWRGGGKGERITERWIVTDQ